MKKILKLFVYSFFLFISFISIVDAKDVSIDELITAIGKSKVGVVDIGFNPGIINVSTSCTFTAKKINDGFSYTPSCMVENVYQPTEEINVSYSGENNTISFKFPGTTIGAHTDYMHYFIAEALGKENVKETLNNSTYKNDGCDLINKGYCQENGIVTYELSDKNYNYLLSGSPSIGDPPLPTDPTPSEQTKNDSEEKETTLDDGKGNNGVIEPETKEDNGTKIENPNTGYSIIILIISFAIATWTILSSKHKKYYKI